MRDGELWRLWYTSVPAPEEMAAEIDRRLGLMAKGSMLPFTVIDRPRGRVVGMTTYMNIDPAGPRVEIGSTWYARGVQRSGLNTEAKLLLLAHAFDAWAASPSSSGLTSSTTRADVRSSGWGPGWTACCATISA